MQRWTATRKSRTRGLTTSGRSVIEASSTRSKTSSPPQAGQASSETGTSIGHLGELLGARRLAALEHPLPGLATGPPGVPDARPPGERRRLPPARTSQLLDLRLQRRDRGDVLE